MLKNLFSFFIHYKIFNPIHRLILMSSDFIPQLNQIKRTVPIIVSMSSDEDGFDNLEYTLYSIFDQKVSPDKVILWLSDEYELSELPYSVTKFVKNGLDIRFVKDAGSYTKIIYAIKEFSDSIIVTAEDNIFYPKTWLSKLYHSYISHPNDVHVHSASLITDCKNKLCRFKAWKRYVNDEKAYFNYFPNEIGGVLYPPNCFIKEVIREDIYKKKINTTWNIWSWVMSVVSGRKIRLVQNHIRRFSTTKVIGSFKKYNNIIKNATQIDIQLERLFEYYGKNINKNLNKK